MVVVNAKLVTMDDKGFTTSLGTIAMMKLKIDT